MRLTFPRDHVLQLLEMSKTTDHRVPILEHIIDPNYWRDDIDPDRRKMLDAEVAEDGFAFSARAEDVDRSKIPTGLILVGDQGVYLMSQAPMADVKATKIDHVCYAEEVNPKTLEFDVWYDRKRTSFGGDDGTLLLTADEVLAGMDQGTDLVLDLTPDHYAVVSPNTSV